jgi:hypothetical protein
MEKHLMAKTFSVIFLNIKKEILMRNVRFSVLSLLSCETYFKIRYNAANLKSNIHLTSINK